jgi:uncharacterized protein (DUF2147 family)
MRKQTLLGLLCMLLCWNVAFAIEDIAGFWKTVNEKTGKAESVVAVYKYKDMYYGRIIGTFDENGNMTDNIYHPIERAPGVVGHPFYSGLDIIWNLRPSGSKFKGKILDPEKGNKYNAELWVEKGILVVRGKVLFFGRSQKWPPMADSDFPPDFKKPDVNEFVPVIPQVE